MAQPLRFAAVVEQVTRHTTDVCSYRLRAAKRLPRFAPGQFIHLTLEPFDPAGFWPESRVFSVANSVADRHTVDLTISRQGTYTAKILTELNEGDTVWAKGPYGEFTIDGCHGYRRVVLIAGGTGVTPFCAFMDSALRQAELPVDQATLHYGVQTPDLLIYRELAERCVAQVSGFHAFYYAERGSNADDVLVRRGRIDIGRILAETAAPEATAFYLSGPKPMIDAFRDSLIGTYGLAPTQVLVDAWE